MDTPRVSVIEDCLAGEPFGRTEPGITVMICQTNKSGVKVYYVISKQEK